MITYRHLIKYILKCVKADIHIVLNNLYLTLRQQGYFGWKHIALPGSLTGAFFCCPTSGAILTSIRMERRADLPGESRLVSWTEQSQYLCSRAGWDQDLSLAVDQSSWTMGSYLGVSAAHTHDRVLIIYVLRELHKTSCCLSSVQIGIARVTLTVGALCVFWTDLRCAFSSFLSNACCSVVY